MPSFELSQREALADALTAVMELRASADDFSGLTDDDLLHLTRLHAAATRSLGAVGALIAGEIARRSTAELGVSGLAQRSGHRTAEELLKQSTGISGRDAARAVRLGRLIGELCVDGSVDPATGEVMNAAQPWLAPIASSFTAGEISAEAVEAIRNGLGQPSSSIRVDQLREAARELEVLARTVDVDLLFRRARTARDELDLAGVALREEERRAQRALRLTVLPTGMGRLVWTMDPETTALVKDLYDRATSPKLGGVRFVDPGRDRVAHDILEDQRTPEQLASDAFEQLLRQGADGDTRFLLGSGAPVIRVAVTATALETRDGVAHIEGQHASVSINTAERLRCGGTIIPVVFDATGKALDVGREQRLFTQRQRHALALRDGGCMAPGCDRPPSWCEAHHIDFWARDGGGTNTADGVLLCKHHHLLFHNAGWEIARDSANRYWLTPPPDGAGNGNGNGNPILMTSKSAVMRDLKREQLA